MIELLEKTMMIGMGALSLSQKKAEELLQELRQRFDISEEEGKKLVERLQQFTSENQKKLAELAQDEVKKACERVGIVTIEEHDKLKKRVAALEKQIKSMPK